MNKIINIILSGLLWRQYKFLIASLILLVVSIFIIGQVHDDYISYAQTSEQAAQVGWSFVVKWMAWLLAVILFLISNHIVNARKEKLKARNPSKSLKSILSFKALRGANKEASAAANVINQKETGCENNTKQQQESSGDPFAHLRDKDKLRSFADLLIEKHDKK